MLTCLILVKKQKIAEIHGQHDGALVILIYTCLPPHVNQL